MACTCNPNCRQVPEILSCLPNLVSDRPLSYSPSQNCNLTPHEEHSLLLSSGLHIHMYTQAHEPAHTPTCVRMPQRRNITQTEHRALEIWRITNHSGFPIHRLGMFKPTVSQANLRSWSSFEGNKARLLMTSQILRKVPMKLHWTCPTEGTHQLPQVPLSSQTHQISVVRQDYWPSPTWNTLPFSLVSFLYLQRLRIQTGHQEVGKNHLRAQYTNTAWIWKVSHSVTAGCVFPKYSRNTSVTASTEVTTSAELPCGTSICPWAIHLLPK